jgi:beta-barrel assembly-enhancing protease
MSEYPCQGFHDDLPKGKASGTLRVTATGFEFAVGDKHGRLPFEGAEIKLGGASDRLVFISHPALVGWTLYTSERSLLDDPRLRAHSGLGRQAAAAQLRDQWNWAVLVIGLIVLIGVPILLVWRIDWLSAPIARQVPAAWEQKLGETAIAQYRFSHRFLPQEQTDRLVAPLVKPLLGALQNSRYTYHFEIVNEAAPNAFALPGGFVVIHSGLILDARNAEELLGVLAHEITHAEQQHGVRNMIAGSGVYLVVSAFVGDVGGLLATLANAAPLLLTQSYSRAFEEEADTLGFRLLQAAHIDPRGLASFFERLVAEEKKQLEKIDNETARETLKLSAKFLSTHPATNERVRYLREMAAQAGTPGYIDQSSEFAALKLAVQQYVTENQRKEEKHESGN